MQCSVRELAERLNIDYADAQGLKNLLVKRGFAKEVSSRPASGGKGKPTKVYEFPDRVELKLSA